MVFCIAEFTTIETNCLCSHLRLKRLDVLSTHLLVMSMFNSWKSLKVCLKLFIVSQGKEDAHKYNFVSSILESTSDTTDRDLEERSLSG